MANLIAIKIYKDISEIGSICVRVCEYRDSLYKLRSLIFSLN